MVSQYPTLANFSASVRFASNNTKSVTPRVKLHSLCFWHWKMKQCVKSALNIKKTFEKGTFIKTHFLLLSWSLLNIRSLTSKLAGISPRGSWRQATVTWWMAVQAKNAVASRKSTPPCTFFVEHSAYFVWQLQTLWEKKELFMSSPALF